MIKLINKEFRLSINKFFLIFPILLALLLFIPNWIFMLVFMYLFWISIPQIYAAYQYTHDYDFTVVLPVSKKELVYSRGISLMLLELYHLVLVVITGFAHNLIYGSANYFLDIQPSFFGYALIMFGIFNIIFLPGYFKTAYRFGIPLIHATIVTLIYGVGLELLALFSNTVRPFLENPEIGYQTAVTVIGIVVFGLLSYISLRISYNKYLNIN